MSRIATAVRTMAFLAVIAASYIAPSFAATLLPPGEITFLDSNGNPLADGKVYFYIPSTVTPKDTWQDSGQTVLNTNPVVLDSAGRAIIYGSGSYRQIVKDSVGNTIWDQLTADTAPTTNTTWGGTSYGSANAQQVLAPGFTSSTGQILSFIAGYTNSGATTLAIGSSPAETVLKNSPSGPVDLTGGEIVASDVTQVLWDGTEFILLGPSASGGSIVGPLTNLASASTTNLCSIPSHNINITGTVTITSLGSTGCSADYPIYNVIFGGVLTLTYNATSLVIPGGNSVVTNAGDSAVAQYLGSGNWRIIKYQPIFSLMPVGASIDYAGTTAPAGWLLEYGQAVSRTTYAALFAAIGTTYGTGDGSTTFNLPDARGRVVAGKDDMGGSAASRLTNTYAGFVGATLGAAGGDQRSQAFTIGSNITSNNSGTGYFAPTPGGSGGTAPTFTTSPTFAGNSQNVQPTIIMNKIIYAGAL